MCIVTWIEIAVTAQVPWSIMDNLRMELVGGSIDQVRLQITHAQSCGISRARHFIQNEPSRVQCSAYVSCFWGAQDTCYSSFFILFLYKLPLRRRKAIAYYHPVPNNAILRDFWVTSWKSCYKCSHSGLTICYLHPISTEWRWNDSLGSTVWLGHPQTVFWAPWCSSAIHLIKNNRPRKMRCFEVYGYILKTVTDIQRRGWLLTLCFPCCSERHNYITLSAVSEWTLRAESGWLGLGSFINSVRCPAVWGYYLWKISSRYRCENLPAFSPKHVFDASTVVDCDGNREATNA
jgi:hypothetical protein